MAKIGIITIHKINNYGSVFQAYALQKACEKLGNQVEIIDYDFPNKYHKCNKYTTINDAQSNEPKWIKFLFSTALIKQHRGISRFVKHYQHLSKHVYNSPEELIANPPQYEVYITGSDQLWNPRHCNGDPAFLLHFAPNDAIKIAYAASLGTKYIPDELRPLYKRLFKRYNAISVREESDVDVIKQLVGIDATHVLDPTLLLNKNEWNKIATAQRLIKKKYILCYFLNYTFNAFPYVDKLTEYICKQTGYEVVWVSRPPHQLNDIHFHYRIGASPEDFLALVRDAEMILTTSFHGTAFAVNYGKPVFSIVQNKNTEDSRQVSLMRKLGLEKQVLTITDDVPSQERFVYDIKEEQHKLETLRQASIQYLKRALNGNK